MYNMPEAVAPFGVPNDVRRGAGIVETSLASGRSLLSRT